MVFCAVTPTCGKTHSPTEHAPGPAAQHGAAGAGLRRDAAGRPLRRLWSRAPAGRSGRPARPGPAAGGTGTPHRAPPPGLSPAPPPSQGPAGRLPLTGRLAPRPAGRPRSPRPLAGPLPRGEGRAVPPAGRAHLQVVHAGQAQLHSAGGERSPRPRPQRCHSPPVTAATSAGGRHRPKPASHWLGLTARGRGLRETRAAIGQRAEEGGARCGPARAAGSQLGPGPTG